MMKKIISTLLILVMTQFVFAQNAKFQWAQSIGGTSDDYFGASIATDAEGNVYTTGGFSDTVDFDSGPGVFNLVASGNEDIFILKTDSSGNFIWAKRIGGSILAIVHSMFLDSSGFIYMTGQFGGTVDFDPGINMYNLSTSAPITNGDIFISKLDTAGNFVWAKRIGDLGDDVGYVIKEDQFGGIYVSGFFSGTVDFNPNTGVNNLTSPFGYDIYICKLDTAGNFVWAKSMVGASTSADDYCNSLAIDSVGNLYLTGSFVGTTDFDPGIANYFLTATGVNDDIFILKLDSAGNFIWAKKIGNNQRDVGISIMYNSSGIYTSGLFSSTVDFNPGTGIFNMTATGGAANTYIAKFDTAGNFIWAKQFSSNGGGNFGNSILDNSGNIFTTGSFSGTTDFDPGTSNFNITSLSNSAIFISKLDSAGNFVWAKGIGMATGVGENHMGGFIHVDATGNVYTTGLFYHIVDFDAGANIHNLISNGYRDISILKMVPCQSSSSTVNMSACDSYTFLGTTFTNSGVYPQVLENVTGCDSIVTLNLTVNLPTSQSINLNGCDSINLNGQTYITNGTYLQTLTNTVGCDSLLTIVVTLQSSTSSSVSQTACDAYMFNSQTYTASGLYTQTYTNASGCDSIANLNLTINHSTSSSITQSGCDSLVINGQTYTATGTYTQSFTNAAGCDSTVSLQLTINIVNIGVTQAGALLTANVTGANYQWITCPGNTIIPGATNQTFQPIFGGYFAVIVTQNGCTDTSMCYDVIVESSNNYQLNSSIKIYPSPTTGHIQIESEQAFEHSTIRVMNLIGEVLHQENNVNGKEIQLDLANYAKGIYIVDVNEKHVKIVKE